MKLPLDNSTKRAVLIGAIVTLLAAIVLLAFFIFQKDTAKQRTPPSSTSQTLPAKQSSQETIDSTTQTEQKETDQTQAGAVFVGAGAHITVHVEPTNSEIEKSEHWKTLTRLVALADTYDMKLSLHFSPQMAAYVAHDRERLDLVHAWDSNGHEIGFHHHGLSHPVWDGYSNAPAAKQKPGYLGTIDDLMKLIEPLSIDGRIEVGSSTDAQIDWPEDVLYGTNTSAPPSPADLMSSPQTLRLGNQQVTFLTKAPFGVDHGVENATLEDIAMAVETTDEYEYLGITVTDDNLDEVDFADMERVFQLFERWSVQTRPIVDLLRSTPNN